MTGRALLLRFLIDAQSDEPVDQAQDRHRRDEREDERHAHRDRLPSDLGEASLGARRVHEQAREHAGEQRTHDASDQVHADDVERVVDANRPFSSTAAKHTTPATRPITSAGIGATYPDAA